MSSAEVQAPPQSEGIRRARSPFFAALALASKFRRSGMVLNIFGWSPLGARTGSGYRVSVTCSSAQVAHIRALMLQALGQSTAALNKLESSNLADSGRVQVFRSSRLDGETATESAGLRFR